jgi:ADP-ribosylglycohydrolase
MNRDKVLGMFIAGFVGDALGSPVEGFTPEQIRNVHPLGLVPYVEALHHNHFTSTNLPKGSITDDGILTLATIFALTKVGTLDLDAIAESYKNLAAVIEYLGENEERNYGFGRTTLEAIRHLQAGVHWSISGKDAGTGLGNGVAMRCSPLAAWYWYGNKSDRTQNICPDFTHMLIDFASMTHWTQLAAISGIIHTYALEMCLNSNPADFNVEAFLQLVCVDVFGRIPNLEHLKAGDDIRTPLSLLWDHRKEIKDWDVDTIRWLFGNGSPYVYNTLPFVYAFFYQNPFSFATGQKIIEAGGDTDTNGKLGFEMLGALHGLNDLIENERWAIDGLRYYVKLLKAGEEFCDRFHIV